MDTRSRTRLLRRASLAVAALGALVVPATADAAAKPPVITKVTPKNVSVGETLIVNGKNFKVGKGKNTLLFKRDGGKALFVKGGLATKRQIALVIGVQRIVRPEARSALRSAHARSGSAPHDRGAGTAGSRLQAPLESPATTSTAGSARCASAPGRSPSCLHR